jgi:hypothetical protein
MAPAYDDNQAISRGFKATLLLTGSLAQAEGAMLDAVHSLGHEEEPDDALFLRAIKAAVTAGRQATAQAQDFDLASSVLPLELRRVLLLPLDLRHCFVLRFLAGFSREDCARLLHLRIERVDDGVSAAVQALAGIFEAEKAESACEGRSSRSQWISCSSALNNTVYPGFGQYSMPDHNQLNWKRNYADNHN